MCYFTIEYANGCTLTHTHTHAYTHKSLHTFFPLSDKSLNRFLNPMRSFNLSWADACTFCLRAVSLYTSLRMQTISLSSPRTARVVITISGKYALIVCISIRRRYEFDFGKTYSGLRAKGPLPAYVCVYVCLFAYGSGNMSGLYASARGACMNFNLFLYVCTHSQPHSHVDLRHVACMFHTHAHTQPRIH